VYRTPLGLDPVASAVKSRDNAANLARAYVCPWVSANTGLMPLVSGFDVLESLRTSTEDYQPVVFMVTAVDKSRRWEANTKRDFQVAEYLEKPFEPDDLVHAISRHFPGFHETSLATA